MKRRNLRSYGLLFVAAALVLFIIQWKLDIHWGVPAIAQKNRDKTKSPFPQPSETPFQGMQVPSNSKHAPLTPLRVRLLKETERVGTLNEDPRTVEAKLNEWGQSLTESDVEELREILRNSNSGGDEIALSLDLLGRSDLASAEELLTETVLSEGPGAKSEKSTFQLLALEGVMDQSQRTRRSQNLERILNESTDSYIAKRAAQALGALKGQNPWPHETDEKSLRKITPRE